MSMIFVYGFCVFKHEDIIRRTFGHSCRRIIDYIPSLKKKGKNSLELISYGFLIV